MANLRMQSPSKRNVQLVSCQQNIKTQEAQEVRSCCFEGGVKCPDRNVINWKLTLFIGYIAVTNSPETAVKSSNNIHYPYPGYCQQLAARRLNETLLTMHSLPSPSAAV